MQSGKHNSKRSQRYDQDSNASPPHRTAPKGMPHDISPTGRIPRQDIHPQNSLPSQKPITDDIAEEHTPAKWKAIALRVAMILMLALALALFYIFLLLGEPKDMATDVLPPLQEEPIRVTMVAVELQGESNLPSAAATFGKPMLALHSGVTLQKAALYDTAFQGGFARRATITYAFEDGQLLTVDSIRPTAASPLLTNGETVSLSIDTLYALAGFDAVRMNSAGSLYIVAKGTEAAYAVRCPVSHADELSALLKQTMLLHPEAMGN